MRFSRLLTVAVLAASMAAATGCASTPPPVSERVQRAYEDGLKATPLPTATVAPLVITPGTRTVFFGDSWTAGYAAAPSTQGYAYLTGQALGLDFTVDTSGSGTGYLTAGPENKGTYGSRLSALPVAPDVKLLILQGGLNDQGKGMAGFVDAAKDALSVARTKFPAAQIVMMGPISPTRTASADLMTIDSSLRGISEADGLHYISGHQDHWITPENIDTLIDASKASHPSTAGHAYLAQRLTEDLRRLSS